MRRPAPLSGFAWQPCERPEVRARRRDWFLTTSLVGAVVGVAAMLDLALHPIPRLVWNASASAPIGLWRIDPKAEIRVGDMVLVPTPSSVRRLADARHYIPAHVPLLKRVVADDGDLVCADLSQITINRQLVAVRESVDHAGRVLPWWHGCVRLRGQVFLLMPARDSFDSRYFGPVDRSRILGKATPLWLR